MRSGVPVLVLCLGVIGASTASADTIRVTGGSGSLAWDGSLTGFQLLADDAQINSEVRLTPMIGVFHGGDVVDLSGIVGLTNGGNHPLLQVVDGVQYNAWLSGSLVISAAPFIAPHSSILQTVTFTAPFTFTGHVQGFANRDASAALVGPLFTADLSGAGTTSLTVVTRGDDTFTLAHAGGQSFAFSAAPAATPEPGTLLLFATGAAAFLVWRRRALGA